MAFLPIKAKLSFSFPADELLAPAHPFPSKSARFGLRTAHFQHQGLHLAFRSHHVPASCALASNAIRSALRLPARYRWRGGIGRGLDAGKVMMRSVGSIRFSGCLCSWDNGCSPRRIARRFCRFWQFAGPSGHHIAGTRGFCDLPDLTDPTDLSGLFFGGGRGGLWPTAHCSRHLR